MQYSTTENINVQIDVLIQYVCSEIPDPEDCMAGVKMYWPQIAKLIYSSWAVPSVCQGILNGPCQAM